MALRATAARLTALVGLWSAFACVTSVELDEEETGAFLQPPRAAFDPATRSIPLPNALLMDPATGRVSLPAGCGEESGSAAADLRTALSELDGFGTSRANLVAPLSEPVDMSTLAGRVFLLRLAENGEPVETFEGPVAIDVVEGSSLRTAEDCGSSEAVPNLTIVPRAPLRGASTYAVVLLGGIESERGVPLEPSATWALTREAEPPVEFSDGDVTHNRTPFDPADPEDLASLEGLDRLWRAHAPLLTAIDRVGPALRPGSELRREDILLAWAFDTQTIEEPFDFDVMGSPASALEETSVALELPAPVAGAGGPLSVEEFLALALPGVPCSALGCDAIGAIYAVSPASEAPSFTSPSFLARDDCAGFEAGPPGAFSDPLAPVVVCERQIPLLVTLPAQPPGPQGYGTVIFGHGLGRSKEDAFAIAGALARNGFVTVAFDAVEHGARAVQISADPALGCDRAGADRPCSDTFGPTCAPQCFAPLLSADLRATRDHLRQTVLDQLQLERVLAACSVEGACDPLYVDARRVGYVGQSLGALIGGVTAAVSRTLGAAVLNVGGADWVQVLTDTATPQIRCPLVDALIAGGVIGGEPWNGGENADAACLGDGWKTERGFLEFAAAARWLLDPADAVNYARRYAESSAPPVLLAEVASDPVVPNSATQTFGVALGLSPEAAAIAASPMPMPTPAAVRAGSSWIRYTSLEADPALMFPGNAYGHGSLLSPAEPSMSMGDASGQLGTIQMQVDTLAFLMSHL